MDQTTTDDLQKKLEELKDEFDTYKTKAETDKKVVTDKLDSLDKVLKIHGHQGDDGSKRLEREINLLPGNGFVVADVAELSGFSETLPNGGDRTVVGIATGRDTTPQDGLNNSQIYMEHQYSTDSTTKQTFFQGIRAPIYNGKTAAVTSGGTTLTQNDYGWVPNSMAGAYVVVNNAAGTSFAGYLIASNTSNTLTITGGTFAFSGAGLPYTISVPIYLGSASYPWRRIYTGDLTSGGIRFGFGATGGGQNGLLYMDASGDLYWRNFAGTSTKLN